MEEERVARYVGGAVDVYSRKGRKREREEKRYVRVSATEEREMSVQ